MAVSSIGHARAQANTISDYRENARQARDALSALKSVKLMNHHPFAAADEPAEICDEVFALLSLCSRGLELDGGHSGDPAALRGIGRLVSLLALSIEAQEAGR